MPSGSNSTASVTNKKTSKQGNERQAKANKDAKNEQAPSSQASNSLKNTPKFNSNKNVSKNMKKQNISITTLPIKHKKGDELCSAKTQTIKLFADPIEVGPETCKSFESFSKKAKQLKDDITKVLENQSVHPPLKDLTDLRQIQKEMVFLAKLQNIEQAEACIVEAQATQSVNSTENQSQCESSQQTEDTPLSASSDKKSDTSLINKNTKKPPDETNKGNSSNPSLIDVDDITKAKAKNENFATKAKLMTLSKNHPDDPLSEAKMDKKDGKSDKFDLLDSQIDSESKFLGLMASLKDQPMDSLLEPLCRKLVEINERKSNLARTCQNFRDDNVRLTIVKDKLENICRELHKSNQNLRLESLTIIKNEQEKARQQTAKIQSTLAGVMKLFDENQQKNMNLRTENFELHNKLKVVLEHCDSWEKSMSATFKQKDLQIKLLKTEIAKMSLVSNVDKERLLKEKQHILNMMQEQQHRIEGQEAKLRQDLSNYASKYDECQNVISNGMSQFKSESKRMLSQIEQSRKDYKNLMIKYETSNRKMTDLLEQKNKWTNDMSAANKKIETLEKLCRALQKGKDATGNDIVRIEQD